MKLSRAHFISELDKGLKGIYCLCADESIQIEELKGKLIDKAKLEGYEERVTHVVSKETDWSFLDSENDNLDLFGSKKILEIKLLGQGPGTKGSKAIKDYCQNQDNNKLIVFSAERLDKKQLNSAWLKSIDEAGILVIEPAITSKTIYAWIKRKAEEIDVELEDEALTLLTERTEGNLFATSQELIKLSLLFDGESISLNKMEKSISNSSRYGIFDLSHAFVEGDKTRMVKIIEILKAEGAQPPLVLWALSKEVNNLYKVLETGSAGDIWGPRYYLDALSKRARKMSLSKIKKSLKEIAEIDSSIKGLSKKSPWQSIRDLVIDL